MQREKHSRPARTCRAFVQRISAAVFLLFAALISRADNVTYPVTNSMTGTLDTNSITLQTVTFVDAVGTVHTAGFPTILTPSNGVMCVWSNMPSGLWLARSKFFANTWLNSQFQQGEFMGPGQPATPQGILFWVGNSTNTYPFTQYPLSNGHDGYNAFTFNSGIYGASLSGGFTGGVTNGVLYLNGSGFTPVLNPANITNGLGYIPANTNTVISTITPTNGPVAVTLAGQTLFVGADTNTAGTVAANQATNKLSQSAYEPTNTFDLAGAATSAANQSTNQLQQSAYEPTNVFDLAGSANAASKAATNNIGVGSQLSAFVNTNQFDAAGDAAAGTNAVLGALSGTNTAIQNLMAYDRAKINCNTNFIMVSGGTSSYASLNGTNVWDNASPGWTNINNLGAISVSGIYSVSAVNVAQTTGGYPVGTLTAITGSGTLPIDGFATNGIQAGANVTFSQVQGNFIISSTGGSGSASSNTFSGQLNFGQIYPTADTNGAGLWGMTTAFQGSTNFSLLLGQQGSNFVYFVGNNGTNFGLGVGQNDTNFAFVVSNTLHSFTLTIGSNDTNWANQVSNSVVTFTFTVGQNDTNFSFAVSNNLLSTIQLFGTQETNWGWAISNGVYNASTATASAALISTNTAIMGNNRVANSVTNGQTTVQFGTINVSTAVKSVIGGNTIIDANGAVHFDNGNSPVDFYNNTPFGFLGSDGEGNSKWTQNANSLTNIPVNQTGYYITTNIPPVSGTNMAAYNSGGEIPVNLYTLPYDSPFQGTNSFQSASNLTFSVAASTSNDVTQASNAVQQSANVALGYTNNTTHWAPTFHNVTYLGGNPWTTETNSILGFTNWPSVNGFTRLTMTRFAANLWYVTNNPMFWAISNGTTVSLVSNVTTIATATALTGPWAVQAPGSGTAGGSYIGQVQNNIGVETLNPQMRDAVFENPPQDATGVYPAASNIVTYTGIPGQTINVNVTGSAGTALLATNGGAFIKITSLVPTPNTNQLWVSGAGSTAFNGGPYTLWNTALPIGTGGFAYTNIISPTQTNYIIAQFGGTSSGDGGLYEQKPFIMGTTTNNESTASGPPNYSYFSAIAITAYWTNGDSFLGGGSGDGALPPPTVTYGTNFSTVTYTVYINPNYFSEQFTNGCIYVATNGNDILASNLQCAFQTCQAAKRFAPSGSTIYVQPGIYYDRDLLKNGVDWQFEKNSVIAWDEPQTDFNPRGIFDDYAGAVTSTITGDRIHYTLAIPGLGYETLITNPASHITIQFSQSDAAVYVPPLTTDAIPGAPSLPQGGGSGVLNVIDASYVDANYGLVSGFTNTFRKYLNAAQPSGSPTHFGQYVTITNNDQGFGWAQGECHIHVKSETCTNAPAGTGPSYGFVSSNNGNTETSCFFTADYVNAFLYWDDANPLARTWLNITYLVAPPVDIPALRYYGNGVHYYTGQKISGGVPGGTLPVFDTGGGTFNFHLWADIQKITENGSGYWMNLSGPCSTWWHVLYFEDNSGNTMTGGIKISGGTNFFFDGDVVLSNAQPVTISGGLTTLQGMSIQGHGTNAALYYTAPALTNGVLTLNNDVLQSESAISIWCQSNIFVNGQFIANVAPSNTVHMLEGVYNHTDTLLP